MYSFSQKIAIPGGVYVYTAVVTWGGRYIEVPQGVVRPLSQRIPLIISD